jgi:hypothetical protein
MKLLTFAHRDMTRKFNFETSVSKSLITGQTLLANVFKPNPRSEKHSLVRFWGVLWMALR